jgi:hypothetical protein
MTTSIDLFIICHYPTGGAQSEALCKYLTDKKVSVYLSKEDIPEKNVIENLTKTVAVLIFLSKNVLEQPWIHTQVRQAMKMNKPFLLMQEPDTKHEGFSDIYEIEKNTPEDIQYLISETEAMPFIRTSYMIESMVNELIRRINKRKGQ